MMEHLSRFVGYQFDESDWLAIEAALPDTDADEPDTFYEYPLIGKHNLTVHLAREVGAQEVAVKVGGPLNSVLRARVEVLLDVLSDVEAQTD